MEPEASSVGPPEVVCKNLSKSFETSAGALEVVSSFDVALSAGETTAFVGPSGCGKSTVLRMIAGLEAPSSGRVRIGADPPAAVRRRAGLSMAFQDASLLPWRSVRGNVALARRLARQRADSDAVDALISLVGLDGFEDQRPAELSGGMRQRAAIARCLVTQPGLLLLDEPFGAVDELTRARLNRDLPALWQDRGTTTLLVTHSVSEAVLLSDRVIVFSTRPARVVADIAVPIAHPRRSETRTMPEFQDLVAEVGAALSTGGYGATPIAAE